MTTFDYIFGAGSRDREDIATAMVGGRVGRNEVVHRASVRLGMMVRRGHFVGKSGLGAGGEYPPVVNRLPVGARTARIREICGRGRDGPRHPRSGSGSGSRSG